MAVMMVEMMAVLLAARMAVMMDMLLGN